MSVVVVNAVGSLSASSFACRCSLVSALERACRRFLAACSVLCDVFLGRTSRTIDIGFTNILLEPF